MWDQSVGIRNKKERKSLSLCRDVIVQPAKVKQRDFRCLQLRGLPALPMMKKTCGAGAPLSQRVSQSHRLHSGSESSALPRLSAWLCPRHAASGGRFNDLKTLQPLKTFLETNGE